MNENYTYDRPNDSVLTAMVPRPTEEMKVNPEVREAGLYTASVNTLAILREVEDMLELFHREVHAPATIGDTECKRHEPTNFKENIDMIHVTSYSIKCRLEDLMAIFRS